MTLLINRHTKFTRCKIVFLFVFGDPSHIFQPQHRLQRNMAKAVTKMVKI